MYVFHLNGRRKKIYVWSRRRFNCCFFSRINSEDTKGQPNIRAQRHHQDLPLHPSLLYPVPTLLRLLHLPTNNARASKTITFSTTRGAIASAAILIAATSLISIDISTLRQSNSGVLIRRILLIHWQPFISAAVNPDEDGCANGLGAVGASGGLGGADVAVGCVPVALLVAPNALGSGAAVIDCIFSELCCLCLLERVRVRGKERPGGIRTRSNAAEAGRS